MKAGNLRIGTRPGMGFGLVGMFVAAAGGAGFYAMDGVGQAALYSRARPDLNAARAAGGNGERAEF